MAQNYSNITITSTQSDNYISDERSIELTGFSRRVTTVDTTNRLWWVDTTNDFADYKNDQYAYRISSSDVKYVRIKNLDSSNNLEIGLVSGSSGASSDMDSFNVVPGEVFIIYDLGAFRFMPNEDAGTGLSISATNTVANIIIGAASGTAQVDSYIGFNQS